MTTDRQIVFTSRKVPNNSFTMRGEQIARALRDIGYNTACLHPDEVLEVKNAVVIWVRRALINWKMKAIHDNGNIQVYDPLDRINPLFNDLVSDYIQAIIYPSKTQYNNAMLNKEVKQCYYLLHHYDPKLKFYEHDHFELGYWGYRTSAVNVFNFIQHRNRFTSARSGEYPPEDFFKRVSCHYSVRDEERGFGWRPTTKICTAAACGANIILSRDAISEELLPLDYPYFINGYGYEDTQRMIDFARMTYGTYIWNYGLSCMGNVREKMNIKNCAERYGSIIEDICKRIEGK